MGGRDTTNTPLPHQDCCITIAYLALLCQCVLGYAAMLAGRAIGLDGRLGSEVEPLSAGQRVS